MFLIFFFWGGSAASEARCPPVAAHPHMKPPNLLLNIYLSVRRQLLEGAADLGPMWIELLSQPHEKTKLKTGAN